MLSRLRNSGELAGFEQIRKEMTGRAGSGEIDPDKAGKVIVKTAGRPALGEILVRLPRQSVGFVANIREASPVRGARGAGLA